MGFLEDLTDYVEAQTSLIIDTDLFIASEPTDSPTKFAVITESPGCYETESGMQVQPIQVLTKDLTYLTAQALANTIFNVLKNKPGFSDVDLSAVFYCEDLSMPFCVGQDDRGRWVFSTNFLIRMRS